jgi:hypothetical protein
MYINWEERKHNTKHKNRNQKKKGDMFLRIIPHKHDNINSSVTVTGKENCVC